MHSQLAHARGAGWSPGRRGGVEAGADSVEGHAGADLPGIPTHMSKPNATCSHLPGCLTALTCLAPALTMPARPHPHQPPSRRPPSQVNGKNPATNLLDSVAALNITVLRVFATGTTPELPVQVSEGLGRRQEWVWPRVGCRQRPAPGESPFPVPVKEERGTLLPACPTQTALPRRVSKFVPCFLPPPRQASTTTSH